MDETIRRGEVSNRLRPRPCGPQSLLCLAESIDLSKSRLTMRRWSQKGYGIRDGEGNMIAGPVDLITIELLCYSVPSLAETNADQPAYY